MRYPGLFVFIGVSLLFALSRYILFNGFNGSDDLHYGMLAAKLLQGTYNPFEAGDIFSGRILLIACQAVIYKVGGINELSTAAGTIIAAVVACYLTVFRLLDSRSPVSIFFASALFYCNPSVSQASSGILPDTYILLMGTIILILLKKNFQENIHTGTSERPRSPGSLSALFVGIIIALGLLIKETMIIFIPFLLLFLLLTRPKGWWRYILNIMIGFSFMIAIYAVSYYMFTGDPFFRIRQIQNGSYPNLCNFASLPSRDLYIRLTYGMWQHFIMAGIYPIVLGILTGIVLLIGKLKPENKSTSRVTGPDFHKTSGIAFLILILLVIYFPFSLSGYQPLCAEPRHYLFLIPLAIVFVTSFFSGNKTSRQDYIIFSALNLIVVIDCITNTQNKWQWLSYTVMFASVLCGAFAARARGRVIMLALPVVLLASLFSPVSAVRPDWFEDMKQLKPRVNSKAYYFIDHDNMMHWKLLDGFDSSSSTYINLNPDVYGAYKLYYSYADSTAFVPGWLIVNKIYPGEGAAFKQVAEANGLPAPLSYKKGSTKIDAYYIDNVGLLQKLSAGFKDIK